MAINDPKGNQVRALKRAPRQVAVATDLRNASVSGGQTRFIGLLSLIVSGSALVTGLLTVLGNLIVSGYHGITGTFNSSGPWNFSGTGGITGNVSSTGDWTQTGTYSVTGGGKIIVLGSPAVSLGVTAAGIPGLEFAGLGYVIGFGGGVVASNLAQTHFMRVSATDAGIQGPAGTVVANSTGVALVFPLTPTTTSPANLYRNGSGYLQISSSASRYKLDSEPMDLPDSLLDDVPVEWWFDAGDAERLAALVDEKIDEQPRPYTHEQQQRLDAVDHLRRIPGVIAEKVEAAGGDAFVTRDEDGTIQGVMYDRLAIARTQVLADRLEAALDRIDQLERLVTQ